MLSEIYLRGLTVEKLFDFVILLFIFKGVWKYLVSRILLE
jgi:hypothetical protein